MEEQHNIRNLAINLQALLYTSKNEIIYQQ